VAPVIAASTTEMVDLSLLKPYPGNARAGDVELIQESVELNGQYKPMCVNRRTNEVLGGNHLLHALLAAGRKRGKVVWVDVDETQARKINLVLNRAHDMGSYDFEALLALASDGPLEGTGFEAYTLEILSEQSRDPLEVREPTPDFGDDDDDSGAWKLRWGKRKILMTDDEFNSLVALYNDYRESNQSDIGFGYHLAEGHA
jgi:ParB-like chromosome segregation protein Spo0J